MLNEIIAQTLTAAHLHNSLEPQGLCRRDGKRPDGAKSIPWCRGSCLVWDATTSDTFAPSYIGVTSKSAGTAAAKAVAKKSVKYREIAANNDFVAIAIETLGSYDSSTWNFIQSLGKPAAARTHDQCF